MADYGRRSGYNGNFNYNRKRRHHDDESDYRQQRRRHDVPAPVRIRRRLLSLAESPVHRWNEEVVEIARLVTDHDDNGVVREGFVDLACQLVREQPLKTPFVAAALLVINVLKPDIVREVLRTVAGATERAVAAGHWRDVKLNLRLVACLQTCLEGDGVFPLLDTLFARAVDLQTASSDDVVGTELVKIILLTIPYVMAGASPPPGAGEGGEGGEGVDMADADGATSQQEQWERWKQRAADLMEKTEVIASEPHALQAMMDPYHHGLETGGKLKKKCKKLRKKAAVDEGGDDDDYDPADLDKEEDDDDDADDNAAGPPPAESLIALLQKQLQAEAANGWPLACLPRFSKLPMDDATLRVHRDGDRDGEGDAESRQPDAATVVASTKHALPAIAVPAVVMAGPRPLFPEVYFSVYNAWVDDAPDPLSGSYLPPSVPPLTDVASSLIRDSLLDTVNGLDFNRNATARFLIDIDCYFADNTFVKRATPFDRLRDVEPGRSTWKPEDVAVDTVFAQLFQLPQPEHKLVYYHAVLAEACKIAPAAIAPSLGRAIRFLYRHSPRMDLALVGRFVDWFAHHLSNFGFTWKWAEWVEDVPLPGLHPHKAFILGAIDKEIRLSFAQRIKKTLPEPYQALISADTEQDVPPFKYAETKDKSGREDEDGMDVETAPPFAAEGRELAALLRRKAPDEEVQAVIERIHGQALDDEHSRFDPLVTSTDVFTTAVLWVGSKSLSHVLAAIERTKDRLLDAGAASEAARVQILDAVMVFWAAHPGVAVAIAEKLLNYAILTPAVIVQWALGPLSVSSGAAQPLAGAAPQPTPRLACNHVAELVFNTVDKVTRRVHQLVAASQTAAAAAAAAEAALEAAKVRQANPPPIATSATSAAAGGGGAGASGAAEDMDVAMDEEGRGGGGDGKTAVAAEAEAAAEAAAAAVEAADLALSQAGADLETARAAEAAETRAMRELFRLLGEALQPWLAGEMVGGSGSGSGGDGDDSHENGDDEIDISGDVAALTRAWASRWQRVVQRRVAVEEAFLRGVTAAAAAAAKAASEANAANGTNGTNGSS